MPEKRKWASDWCPHFSMRFFAKNGSLLGPGLPSMAGARWLFPFKDKLAAASEHVSNGNK